MGRNPKVGLDYFPLDTSWDIKMQLVKAKFGLEGVGCIVELFKLIYSEGYYIKWDDDNRLLFAAENKIDENKLAEIVDFSCRKGVFHAGKLDLLGVLTSSGIQKRWARIASDSNRTIQTIDETIAIIDTDVFSAQKIEFPAQEIPHKSVISGTEKTQSKVKERKEEYIDTQSSRFNPPTLEEVTIYCSERKNSVDPERFMDYYESKGWIVGKSKMKNWKAAVRTWEHNGFTSNESSHGKIPEEREEPKASPITPEERAMMERQYRELGLIS